MPHARHTAEYFREYRAKRTAEGKPVGRSSPRPKNPPRSERGSADKLKIPNFARAQFIGWDGEGASTKYVLFKNSVGVNEWDAEGLHTERLLRTLLASAKQFPGAIHVCYGAGYDVNQIVQDFTREQVTDLWQGRKVGWGNLQLEYRSRKSLTVREIGYPTYIRGKHGMVPNVKGRVVLWDVLGFFQSTFVDAVVKYLGEDYVELPLIREGKARRSQFDPAERPFIERYTAAELRALVDLMNQLREYLVDADLPIARWDGAGAVAASLLRRERVKQHMQTLPDRVEAICQHAYAGGRMEVPRYGTYEGPVYHYDLNSAYPTALLDLPALKGGKWIDLTFTGEHALPLFSICLLRWDLQMADASALEVFPFFYRGPQGDICFPPAGTGWYWTVEVSAFWRNQRRYKGSMQIERVLTFVPDPEGEPRPFAFVREVYEQRRKWKEEGRGAEKVLKLGINSLYGKMAQQLGYSSGDEDDDRQRRPPFHNLAWAGYVTAHARARLLDAALQRPEGVVMLATDAIYSTAPLALPEGGELGEWSAHEHSGIVVVQSGVYWTSDGEVVYEFRRGFEKDSISSSAIHQAWARRVACTCDQSGERCQKHYFQARATRFLGMGSAIVDGDERFRQWRTWPTIPRFLRLDSRDTKRTAIAGPAHPDRELVPTQARYVLDPETPSFPYPLRWRDEEWRKQMIDGVDEREFAREIADLEV